MKTQTVEYKHDSVTCAGFAAYDDAIEGKRPGVLIVHDWFGPGAHTEERALLLAKLGYVGFAIDMFGTDLRPKNRDQASQAITPLVSDRKTLRSRALAGLDAMKRFDKVDAKRIGAIGFCFGGLTVLEIARSSADIGGVVSFHGILANPNPEDAKKIKAKVLVLHGIDDPMAPYEHVSAMWKEMAAAKADMQFIGYSNTVHAFTNKQANDAAFGTVYNASTDARSWEHMKLFFREVFGG